MAVDTPACTTAPCICTVPNVSSAAPRASFDVKILEGGFELHGKGKSPASHTVLPSMVTAIHEIPQMVAYKGAARLPSKIMLTLAVPLQVQRSQYSYLVLHPKPGTVADVLDEGTSLPPRFEGLDREGDALLELIPRALDKVLERPLSKEFESFDGHPSVRCNCKTNEGLLFPMPSGLVFVHKPAIFIPCPSVRSVQFFPTPRFLELEVTFLDGSDEERVITFSTIDRDEETSLQSYVRCKRLGKPSAGGAMGAAATQAGQCVSKQQRKGAGTNKLEAGPTENLHTLQDHQQELPGAVVLDSPIPVNVAKTVGIESESEGTDDSDWPSAEGDGESSFSSAEDGADFVCEDEDMEDEAPELVCEVSSSEDDVAQPTKRRRF